MLPELSDYYGSRIGQTKEGPDNHTVSRTIFGVFYGTILIIGTTLCMVIGAAITLSMWAISAIVTTITIVLTIAISTIIGARHILHPITRWYKNRLSDAQRKRIARRLSGAKKNEKP